MVSKVSKFIRVLLILTGILIFITGTVIFLNVVFKDELKIIEKVGPCYDRANHEIIGMECKYKDVSGEDYNSAFLLILLYIVGCCFVVPNVSNWNKELFIIDMGEYHETKKKES